MTFLVLTCETAILVLTTAGRSDARIRWVPAELVRLTSWLKSAAFAGEMSALGSLQVLIHL